MTPMQFLQLIRSRKFKGKKSCFLFRIQISAISFQVDCAINQFGKFLLFRGLLTEVESSRTSLASSTSSRTHFELFLALASKVKSLASKPQVLENCPVLGSRTALFFKSLKLVGKLQKPRGKFSKTFFVFFFWRSPEKNF